MRRLQRILLTTSTFPVDEDDRVSARFVLDLAQHLAAHVRVFVLAPAGPRTRPREDWGDVTVLRYRYFTPRRLQVITAGQGILAAVRSNRVVAIQIPMLAAAQWARLPSVVRTERIDLVNAHWIVPQGLNVALWRRRLGVANVVTAHGADVAFLARAVGGARLARYVLDRTDGFLPASRYLADKMQELTGRSIASRTIAMGVSDSRFSPAGTAPCLRRTQDERVLLFVGKLVQKKGLSVLIDAVHRLLAEGQSLRLIVVGGGPLDSAVRLQIRRLDLADAIEMVGWIRNDELPGYYRAADIVCIPSVRDDHGETEGTPVVLQEALACGATVVATRSSGISDVVRHGINGWLVEPGDPTALAVGIRRALSSPPHVRQQLSDEARATASGHRWESVAERYMEAFAEAFANGARSS